MNVIGSVFLGDAARHRLLSSPSTPPSSPPPPGFSPQWSPSKSLSSSREHAPVSPLNMEHSLSSPPPPPIDSELSLQLRIRWLEALLLGVKGDAHNKKEAGLTRKTHSGDGATLLRQAEKLQRRVNGVVETNDSLHKFMDRYPQYAQYLNPSFAVSETSTMPSYNSMASDEFDALLAEMEPEIRNAERDLRDIDVLEKRGVLSAGKLTDYESLLPRLNALVKAHKEDLQIAASLEKRVAALLEGYATHIDALSELFVDWNGVLTAAEDQVSKLERDREKTRRMGYE